MNCLINKIEELGKTRPNDLAVKSTYVNKSITWEKLNVLSGKVYHYLKQHNISKEDVVILLLPRDILMIVAMVGVLKSGACLTIVENTYAKERIDFIIKDSKAKLVLDLDSFKKIDKLDPLFGHEEYDKHDACYIVYTSGSTGNPKGVLHEYGKIEQIIQTTTYPAKKVLENGLFGIVSPLNFLASFLIICHCIANGECIYIIGYDIVKNPPVLAKLIYDEKITDLFMTPTFLKTYKNPSPYLVNFYIGGEACNDVYVDNLNLINSYASSESGLILTSYVLSGSSKITPVGKNHCDIEILITDENDKQLNNGEVGEICFVNEYTRGYLNLPEMNASAFKNSLYHMGDLGYINENGDLVYSGRKDDMIKINGNRVEPGEIEGILKRTLNITNAVVKGFVNDDRTYLCAYFINDELKKNGLFDECSNIKVDYIKKIINDYLPYYMIPTYYIGLDKYPINANGKLAKKELKAPETNDYLNTYEAPTNEIEKQICDIYQKILKKERIGIDDDFYLIGGDSLSSIMFISECNLNGLTVGDIYKYRTPRRIAKYYSETFKDAKDIDYRNKKALEHGQVLLPEIETVLYSNCMMPGYIMWNLPYLLELKDGIDINRLKKAIDKVLSAHPVFSTKFNYDENDRLVQYYNKKNYKEIEIINTTENDFDNIRKTLVKPFETIDNVLYRMALYVTEKSKYFFFDFFHAIIDGTSINIVLYQIQQCYENKNYVIPTDYYYLTLREFEKDELNGKHEIVKDYYKEIYREIISDKDFQKNLRFDHDSELLESGWFEEIVSARKDEFDTNELKLFKGNVFFISMLLLAIAKLNNKNYAFLQYTFNGRDNALKMNEVGLLFKSLPAYIKIKENETVLDLLKDVKNQVDYGTANADIRFDMVADIMFDYSPFFLFQQDLLNVSNFSFVKNAIELDASKKAVDTIIEFAIIDNSNDDSYLCTIEHSKNNYDLETIEMLYKYFNGYILKVLKAEDLNSLLVSDLIACSH